MNLKELAASVGFTRAIYSDAKGNDVDPNLPVIAAPNVEYVRSGYSDRLCVDTSIGRVSIQRLSFRVSRS